MMTTEIKTITGTRNGKTLSLQVEIKTSGAEISDACTTRWVRKADGSPLFGTTGYFSVVWDGQPNTTIRSYRGKVLMTDVAVSA